MKKYHDEHFVIDGVPFSIRRVGSPIYQVMGHFVLFQAGRYRCRGTKKLCKTWAIHFAKVTNG